MGGEGDGLGVEGDVLPPADVATDHRLGAVVEDLGGNPAEVGERLRVAGPERGQVLGVRVAAERVPGGVAGW